MKRFWTDVTLASVDGGWQVMLDGRGVKTQGARQPQVVPSEALGELLADEWRAQGETIDPRAFPARDLADFALDQVRPDRAGAIAKLLAYGGTDTLCYRADPEDALYRRQQEVWEPLVAACEERHGISLARVSGIIARPQSDATLAALTARLDGLDDFTLAALTTMASLTASLVVALAALDGVQPPETLFAAANCEEDWQVELWGWDPAAEQTRANRLAAFELACGFARAVGD